MEKLRIVVEFLIEIPEYTEEQEKNLLYATHDYSSIVINFRKKENNKFLLLGVGLLEELEEFQKELKKLSDPLRFKEAVFKIGVRNFIWTNGKTLLSNLIPKPVTDEKKSQKLLECGNS